MSDQYTGVQNRSGDMMSDNSGQDISKDVEMSRAKLLNGSNEKSRKTDPQSPLDSSGSRAPMLSPNSGHRDYNRYKYYSALRTGYKHLGEETSTFLEPPKHVIDQNLFIIYNPFSAPRKLFFFLLDDPLLNSTCW